MEESNWVNALISAAPFILLIGFWLFFMYFMKGGGTKFQREYIKRHKDHMDRLEELLERIAVALEKR
jgi:ATP-dependent Zn protease